MGVRHYNLVFKAAGPVHVGSGETIGKNDYFISGRDRIAVLDMRRFVAALGPGQFEAYCAFLDKSARASASKRQDNGYGLQNFLDDNREFLPLAKKSIAYEIDSRLSRGRRGYRFFDIAACAKDAYGKPYVPGSSVKGMLRTAILNGLIMEDPKRYLLFVKLDSAKLARGARDTKDLEEMNRRVDREAFWTDFPEAACEEAEALDLMRHLSVSDSGPLDPGCLVLAMKYDKFSKNDPADHKRVVTQPLDKQGNRLNIYRESLKPGTEFAVRVDIDTRIDDLLGFALDAQGLGRILDGNARLYDEAFTAHFDLSGIEGAPAGASGGSAPAGGGRCLYVIQSGPLAGQRCRNRAVGGTGYCKIHQDDAGQGGDDRASRCFVGGGVGFDSKTVWNAFVTDPANRALVKSLVLYNQFPTRIDPSIYRGLWGQVGRSGFTPKKMGAKYARGGRLKKGKDDHRHWQDAGLGVSPHTLKLGEVNGRPYLMGACDVRLEERR